MESEKRLPELRTERLTLRLPGETDVEAIVRFFRANGSHLASTSPPRSATFFTETFWLARIGRIRRDFLDDRACRLFLFDGAGENLRGMASFSEIVRGPFQAAYLGYALGEDQQGKGLMQEALMAAIPYAFGTLGLHRIMANHLPDNHRSASLLRRLGFVTEGLARQYLFIDGEWRDHVLTALTNPGWSGEATELSSLPVA